MRVYVSSLSKRALLCTTAYYAPSGFQPIRPRYFWRRRIYSPATGESPDNLGPLQRYELMVKQGLIQHDVKQHHVVQVLEGLLGEMKNYQKDMDVYQAIFAKWSEERQQHKKSILREQSRIEAQKRLQQSAQKNGIFGWWSRKVRDIKVEPGAGRMVAHIKREKQLDSLVGPQPPLPPSPKGIYLYGNVGCGKTFLMDLFFNATDGVVKYRRRVHFHAAMLEVHDRMHKLWKQRRQKLKELGDARSNSESSADNRPLTLEVAAKEWLEEEERWEEEQDFELSCLTAVADELFGDIQYGGGASLLCFDEVQVTDVFTALALSAILGRLLSRGAVIVATSNRAPQDLNKDGLQKEVFQAFIAKLKKHSHAVLVSVDTDYRRLLASHSRKKDQVNYFWPLGSESQHKLDELWNEIMQFSLNQRGATTACSIPVMFGRVLEIRQSACGAARFSFEELCSHPLGAADYVSVAQNYHTIFITNIPIMSMRNSDQARRFITLVDELYNHHCQLICTAAAPVDELFLGTEEGPIIDLESLQFETEAEGSRLRRDVLVSGGVAPLATTAEGKSSIETLLSGREELFAFRRAASRLIEMESPVYLQALACHSKFSSRTKVTRV